MLHFVKNHFLKNYLKNHSRLLLAVLLSTPCCFVPLKAGCDTTNVVFDVTLADERYLEYLRYKNEFDSATTSYTFGEVQVVHNNQAGRVLLTSFPNEFKRQEGITEQGVDTKLQALGRTEEFLVSSGDHIQFYRELSADAPCNLSRGPGDWRGQTGEWANGHWQVGVNRILDKTEFVLQIVRASGDVVLGTLDSVVVDVNPTTRWAPRYGTNPDPLNHKQTVPAGIASGTKVYLRVSPRRYGSTPLGMVMNKIDSWVSLSTLFERSPTGLSRCSKIDYDTLMAMQFQQVLDFTDNAMLTTGRLPSHGRSVRMSPAQRAEYNQRYLILDTAIQGWSLFYTKDSATFAAQYWSNNLKRGSSSQQPSPLTIKPITPNPANRASVSVQLHAARTPLDVTLDLFDLEGRKIVQLWAGSSSVEALQIGIDNVYSGTYMMVLSATDGTRLDAQQLVVRR